MVAPMLILGYRTIGTIHVHVDLLIELVEVQANQTQCSQ